MPRFRRTFDESLFYYQVGDSKTYNKFEAIKWANGDVSKIHFYFIDEVWDNMDVSVEPTESWSELMRERLLQLRDRYQTLAVSYSGGYDSQTIVDYCIANNIRIDEIVVSTWEYWWNPKNPWQQPEGKTAPRLAQWYKENVYPNLKISLLPRTVDYILDIHRRNEDDLLFVDNNEIGFVKNNRAMHLNGNDIGAGVLAHSTKVTLDGHEKPWLHIKDGWWYMNFSDKMMQFSINSPYEAFYLSREQPKMHLKQVHMMINWLESFPASTVQEVQNILSQCERGNLTNMFYYEWNRAVGRTMVKHWNSFDCYTSGKNVDNPNGIFDNNTKRFYKLYHNVDSVVAAMRKWSNNTKMFINTYKDAFDDMGNNKLMWSKAYKIKPVEPGKGVSKIIV